MVAIPWYWFLNFKVSVQDIVKDPVSFWDSQHTCHVSWWYAQFHPVKRPLPEVSELCLNVKSWVPSWDIEKNQDFRPICRNKSGSLGFQRPFGMWNRRLDCFNSWDSHLRLWKRSASVPWESGSLGGVLYPVPNHVFQHTFRSTSHGECIELEIFQMI